MELSVIGLAAYLHDAGMVVSDSEKAELLSTDEWRDWASRPPFAERLQDIEQRADRATSVAEHFLADVDMRYLVVEYFRQRHHNRSSALVLSHKPDLMAEAALGSRELRDSVAAVCEGHGVATSELYDRHKYPLRRDLLGVPINVRLLTILLRFGDLLDMDIDRACPLMLAAAGTIPSSSAVHWEQYQCINHRVVSPDKIELHARCQTQDQYRVLTDWCQWIVKEVAASPGLLSGAELHAHWTPPVATMSQPEATIDIEAAPGSTFTPSPWRLSLDEEAIFARLSTDLYRGKLAFVRELLQNALDATRCRLYQQIELRGEPRPEYPQLAAAELREQLPIRVTVSTSAVTNALTEASQDYIVLTINDHGVGMTRDIISRYFLQVGKSFYRTDEFRRLYGFLPTSRFGVGFLSIFAASDHVNVETSSSLDPTEDGSIAMLLTGPRNYIVTEHGVRQAPGTAITARLSIPISKGELTVYLRALCRKVEFPIIVDDFGDEVVIKAENPNEFTVVANNPDGINLSVKAFDSDLDGIFGELYFLVREMPNGESWAYTNWARYTYQDKQPGSVVPNLPQTLVALHGLTVESERLGFHESWSYRVDYRKSGEIDLARNMASEHTLMPLLTERMSKLVREHAEGSPFACEPEGWKYLQRLMDVYQLAPLWQDLPGTLRIFTRSGERFESLADLRNMNAFQTVYAFRAPKTVIQNAERYETRELDALSGVDLDTPTILSYDAEYYADDDYRELLFKGRSLTSLMALSNNVILLRWGIDSGRSSTELSPHVNSYAVPLESEEVIGFSIHSTGLISSQATVINETNPLVKWLLTSSHGEVPGVSRSDLTSLSKALLTSVQHNGWKREGLRAFLEKWAALPEVRSECLPPVVDTSEQAFRFAAAFDV
jgi:hypothetical protein